MDIDVGVSIKGSDVIRALEDIAQRPQRIKVDNGCEFIPKALNKLAYENKIILDFCRLGKPTDNAYIESFNGSFRDEYLNIHWLICLRLMSLGDGFILGGCQAKN